MAGPSAFFSSSASNRPRQPSTQSRSGNNRGGSRQNFQRPRTERSDRQNRPVQNRGSNGRNGDKPESFTRLLKSRGNRLPPTFNDGQGFKKRASRPAAKGSALLAAMKATTITSFTNKFDPWDQQNQAELRAMASRSGENIDYQELYNEFQKRRKIERKEMEKRGLVDAPDARKSLDDALVFTGSCPDMCPVFERVRRVHENMLMNLERDEDGQATEHRAVKAFSRPAAGQLPPLPSDVRPPPVLVNTLSYLIREIYPRLPSSHPFLWDRLRSIRQDFTYQNYVGAEAILCNEIIVRTHISTMHVMADSGVEYSQQQEFEQLNKALQSLSEFYSLPANRSNKNASLHEPEMRAFQLISHVNDRDLNAMVDALPEHIRTDPLVVLSRKLRGYINNLSNNTGNFAEFFRIMGLPEIPILFKCLLEPSFMQIRLAAVRCLNSTLHAKKKDYPLERFMEMLGFTTRQEAADFASKAGLIIGENEELGAFITIAPISDELYAKIKGTHNRSSLIPRFPSFDEIINGSSYQSPQVASQTKAEIDRVLDTSKLQQDLKHVKLLPDFSKEEWIRHMEETLRASKMPLQAPAANQGFSFGTSSDPGSPNAAPVVAPSGKFAKFKELQAQKLAREKERQMSTGVGAASAFGLQTAAPAFTADPFSLSNKPVAPVSVPQSAFALAPPQQSNTPAYTPNAPLQQPKQPISAFNQPASSAFTQPQNQHAAFSLSQPIFASNPAPVVFKKEPVQFKSSAPVATVLNPQIPEAVVQKQQSKPLFTATLAQNPDKPPAAFSAETKPSTSGFNFGANLSIQEPAKAELSQQTKPAEPAAAPSFSFGLPNTQASATEPASASASKPVLAAVPAPSTAKPAAAAPSDTDRAAFVKRIVDRVTAEALRLEAYNISRFQSMVARASIEIAERKGLQALLSGALQIDLAQDEPVESAVPVREVDILDLALAALSEKCYESIMICLPDWDGFTGILLRWNLQLEPAHGTNGVYFCASHDNYEGSIYVTTNPNENVDLAVFINMNPSDVSANMIATLELPDEAPAVKAHLLEFLDDLPENEVCDKISSSAYSGSESDSDGDSCMSLDFIGDNGSIVEGSLNTNGHDMKRARYV